MLHLTLRDKPAALRAFEEAVRIAEGGEALPSTLASARFQLAKSLWSTRKQRERARSLAEAAAAAFAELPEQKYGEAARKASAWAASHRP